ncbi:hypothetical protein [Ligilactobacillus apodemi]|uniref:Uncharacterized protein n=1 Tax=Ligilactobacillus apodemi DSM 16634 = JCM 16172 TaxID=1423724 RepID=A0A0R1TYY4_9LACO|nr:hypothetical protein [Ligilactobacillus apodemi]KRL84083.1 hypothetical protein FC32_GL001360 [Ligilactobacillus apodemi DSM 16634 = JCM 16172]
MLEQIKLDACYLFEEERSDKDGVKYAMTMYLLAIGVFTLIFGVTGLVTPFVIEWLRSREKKKPTDTPASEQPTSQSRQNRKD